MSFISTFPITAYAGFSKVSEKLSLDSFVERIVSPTHKSLIDKIAQFIEDGLMEKANNVKRQLPFFTITANYSEKRQPESIESYNDLITIDIDGLTDEQVNTLRSIIERDDATILCFRTAKKHGYKIIARLDDQKAKELRAFYLKGKSITYEKLDEYHGKIYELTRRHYEELLNVKVDTSGKDISRGVFASYDPEAFFSHQRAAKLKPVAMQIVPPEPSVARRGPKSKLPPASKRTDTEIADIDPVTKREFDKCATATHRKTPYGEGSYNTYMYELGHNCVMCGLDEDDVKRLAHHRFSENGKWDTNTPITNGYTYVDKTEKAKKEKENRLPVARQVKNFIDENYLLRRNILLDQMEITERPAADQQSKPVFRSLTAKDVNTIFLDMSLSGISYTISNLKAVIDSNNVPEYDPFPEYLKTLPVWDGKTDYIAQLADTIQTNDQPYWHDALKRWMVAMTVCATKPNVINHLILLLSGCQGKGKSTWLRNLLPPELQMYFHSGGINIASKDDRLLLSHQIVINIDEFDGLKIAEAPALKRFITQESVTVRKPWEVQFQRFMRRVSFTGSTNSMRFLSDVSGLRRFIAIRVKSIDYTSEVNYTGVYSQIVALIESDFKYWFDGDELKTIQEHNEPHRLKDPVEENLFVYFEPASPSNPNARWKTASAILSYLSSIGRTFANMQTQQLLVEVMERKQFCWRTNVHDIVEYCVMPLSMNQIEQNAMTKATAPHPRLQLG